MNEQEINIAIHNLQLGIEKDEIEHIRSQTSMLEIYGKIRSENCHSDFLKWLFVNESLNNKIVHGAVFRLVSIVQKWAKIQKVNLPKINKKPFYDVILESLKVEKVCRELNIKDPKYGDGKIDLVIYCTINCGQKKDYKLNIIIENKVDAPETKKIINASHYYQTDAYYNYFNSNNPNDINLFVFLAPLLTSELGEIKLYPSSSHSDQYVHINYQELYECILLPLYNLSSVSDENKARIDDYIKAICKSQKNKKRTSLAMSQKETQLLIDFYDKNRDLIMDAIKAKSRDTKESNRLAFSEAWEALGGVSTNTYFVNGKKEGLMWDVVRKFAEMLLQQKNTATDIENEIRNMVGKKTTKVKFFDTNDNVFNKYPNGKARCKELTYNGNQYYLTDQWSSDGNFALFMENVNLNYKGQFEIKKV